MIGTALSAISIRGIKDNFEINEELLALYPMKGTTREVDIFRSLMEVLGKHNLQLTNLTGIATDGCPSRIGNNKGPTALVQKYKGDSPILQ